MFVDIGILSKEWGFGEICFFRPTNNYILDPRNFPPGVSLRGALVIKIHVVASVALLASAVSYAQEFRGTFTGQVRDSQGAAIAKVKITATQKGTGIKAETASSETGEYTIPFLTPGEYEIAAEIAGFKTYKREGLTLSIGEHPVVDITLEVGQASQNVMVTAEVPMIESSNASVGQVISTAEVEDIPMNGRTPMMLSRLAMGVIGTNEPGPVRPFDNGTVAGFSVAGAPTQSNELLVNGVPNGTWDKRLAYSPPQDAVQEVSVHVFESDASYGHTGGGVANQITKGGSNGFHGSLYEFNQVSKLDANLFFSNKLQVARPITNYNQYGATFGGPVVIPKVYNGKNKVFWFLAVERLHDSDPANSVVEGGSTITTVPTAAERAGDFSALLKLGGSYQLYDPASGVVSGSQVRRTPIPGNILPPSSLNPIAVNYLKYYPAPNTAGSANGENNFGITAADSDGYDNEFGRMDVILSDKSRLSYDFRHSYRLQDKNIYFGNPAFGDLLSRANWGTTLDEIYTISPTTILDVRASWSRFHEANASPGDGVDPATLGFPSSLAQASQFVGLPYMQFAGGCGANSNGFQCIGMTGDNTTPYDVYQLFGSVVKITGNHTLKFGADLRGFRESLFAHGNSDGTFTYNSNWITGPLNNNAAPPFGGDFASFLLGLPSSGSFDLNTHASEKSNYYSFFLQDDWRARSSLTINLGVRWEHETPTVERYNRAVNGFDPTAVNPISAAAVAAFKTSPVPGVPPSQFTALGGLTYAGASDPNVRTTARPASLQPARRFSVDSGQVGPHDRASRRLRNLRRADRHQRSAEPESGRIQPDHAVRRHQQQLPDSGRHALQSISHRHRCPRRRTTAPALFSARDSRSSIRTCETPTPSAGTSASSARSQVRSSWRSLISETTPCISPSPRNRISFRASI